MLTDVFIVQKNVIRDKNMLYKYRSLNNFKYFVDIILNNRLYASPYFDLNDPMEGYYLYPNGKYSDSILKKIKGEKEKIRICSLTRYENNELMWAHYADGHGGICLGFSVRDNDFFSRAMSVKYKSIYPHINLYTATDDDQINVLLTKSQ